MTNKAIKYIRECFKNAHGMCEGTMADVTEEQAHWKPAGTAHPIGGTYAHMVLCEDMMIAQFLSKKTPLCMAAFSGKVGVDKPMPAFDKWDAYGEWANTVKVSLSQFKAYAQAVYKATDEYIATLTDEDLEKSLDLSMFGMNQQTVGYFMDRFLVGHVDTTTGEIAVLKGLQGLKGYPF